jgi:small subunit ribosomal protein S2
MAIPTLIELAESGAHFGHHRSLTYPKARTFVYTVKNNVALIDLEQTQNAIEQAQKTISEYRQDGKHVLIVGTKRSLRNLIKEVAENIGASYINERWFGGTLTNFSTIKDSVKRMNDLEAFLASPKAAKESKKERLVNERRLNRYRRFLAGLSGLKEMPNLIILASANEDSVAIAEANQLQIPIMAIMDTDMNPDKIAFPIPANDDAPKAIELILRSITSTPGAKKAEKVEETEVAIEEVSEPVAEVKEVKPAKKTAVKKTVVKKAVAEKAEKTEKPKTAKKVTKKGE